MISIQKTELPTPGIEQLHAEARAEGYDFIDTLVEDWAAGSNRFDGPGEGLFACREQEELVAVGALSRDPFAGRADVGRIRRVYVRRAWRNAGVGRALLASLVEQARKTFRLVRLRAENADAARLYERMGFVPETDSEATHSMVLHP